MKALICILATLMGTSALAYTDGTYRCKNGDATLGDRVITIKTVDSGAGPVPFVKIVRPLREGNGVTDLEISGFASYHKRGDSETMMIAAVRLDFKEGELLNCKK